MFYPAKKLFCKNFYGIFENLENKTLKKLLSQIFSYNVQMNFSNLVNKKYLTNFLADFQANDEKLSDISKFNMKFFNFL